MSTLRPNYAITKYLRRGDNDFSSSGFAEEPAFNELGSLIAEVHELIKTQPKSFLFLERRILGLKIKSITNELQQHDASCVPKSQGRWDIVSASIGVSAILLCLNLFCLVTTLVVSFAKDDPDYWVVAIPNRLFLLIQLMSVCRGFFRPRMLWDILVVRLLAQPFFYILVFLRWKFGYLNEPLNQLGYQIAAGVCNFAAQLILTYPLTMTVHVLGWFQTRSTPIPEMEARVERIHPLIAKALSELDNLLLRSTLSVWRKKEISLIKGDVTIIQSITKSRLSKLHRDRLRQEAMTFRDVIEVFALYRRATSVSTLDARRKVGCFFTPSLIINIYCTITFLHSEIAFLQNLFFCIYLFFTQIIDCFNTDYSVREMSIKFCLQGTAQLVTAIVGTVLLPTHLRGIRIFQYLPCAISVTLLGTVFTLTYSEYILDWQQGFWYRSGVIPNENGLYRTQVEAEPHSRLEQV